MNSNLYLLVRKDRTAFKIGITDNIKLRYARLSSVWGEIDLDLSCAVSGDRRDIYGLEKTLHYLLGQWHSPQDKRLDGFSEWFDITCFDKAHEIISLAGLMRLGNKESFTASNVDFKEIKAAPRAEYVARIKNSDIEPIELGDLKRIWPSYESGTLCFRDDPIFENSWIWTVDLSHCLISPYESLKFKSGDESIAIAVEIKSTDKFIYNIFLSKDSLSIMKGSKKFDPVYNFIFQKFQELALIGNSRCRFDSGTDRAVLIEASYRLTLDEQRLILACIAQIDSRQTLPEKNRFEVTVEEFVDLFGVDPDGAYTQMREAAERLAERWIIINGDRSHQARWLYEKKYAHGEGYVAIGFSPTVAPYLSSLHRDFTSYKLGQVAAFKSVHSIRLYELLIRFDDTGVRLMTVDQLKDRLDITDQYPQFSKLKQRVIDPAVDEINQKSDLKVNWKAIRKKRVVHTVEFNYTKEKPPAQVPTRLVENKTKQLKSLPPPKETSSPASEETAAKEIALIRESLGVRKKPET